LLGGGLFLALVVWRLIDVFTQNRPTVDGVLLILVGLAGTAFLLVAGAVAAVGAAMLWTLYRYGVPDRLQVGMGADGLEIPELFEKVIPWSEIADVTFAEPNLYLTIRDELRFQPTGSNASKPGECADSVALPGLLDVTPGKLFEAIQAHRAHFGNGGRPG